MGGSRMSEPNREKNVLEQGYDAGKNALGYAAVEGNKFLDSAGKSAAENAQKNPDDWMSKIGGVVIPLLTNFGKLALNGFGMVAGLAEKGIQLAGSAYNDHIAPKVNEMFNGKKGEPQTPAQDSASNAPTPKNQTVASNAISTPNVPNVKGTQPQQRDVG
jgi:hypothetical protein